MEENSSAQIIERLAKQGVDVKIQEVLYGRSGRAFAFVPDGYNLSRLEFLEPKKVRADHDFIDPESFVSYVKDYANANESRLFGSLGSMAMHCIIDYAPKCNNPREAVGGESLHTAAFCLCETEDFKAWKEIDQKTLSQTEFIQFLMERAHCFENPDQATILEVATKLEVKKNGKIKVPDFVDLAIVAFEGGEPLKIKARFYFKLAGGQVMFAVKLLNLRETILKNFREVCDKIAKDTGLALHYVK